jgi:hypothetical protein
MKSAGFAELCKQATLGSCSGEHAKSTDQSTMIATPANLAPPACSNRQALSDTTHTVKGTARRPIPSTWVRHRTQP